MNAYFIKLIAIMTGVLCGFLLYLGKYNAFVHQNSTFDRLLSILRYIIFVVFLYTTLQLKTTDSILLVVLFLLSYLSTIGFCINKTG